MYDDEWYVGAVLDTDGEENDVNISSLHPKGPAKSFRFPARSDVLWVPLSQIMQKLELNCSTETIRQYTLAQHLQDQVDAKVIIHIVNLNNL